MADVARGHGGDGGVRYPARGSQRVPTGCESSQQKRTRREGRNVNLYDEVRKNGNKRLPLVFDERGKSFKAVGKYHQMFIRLISNSIADVVPPHFTSWAKVPDEFKHHVYRTLNVCTKYSLWHQFFELDSHRQAQTWKHVRAAIDHDCGRRYSERKYALKKNFRVHGGYKDVDMARRNPKPVYSLATWHQVINDLFLNEKYKKQCSEITNNRVLQPYLSRHDSTSFAHKRYLEMQAGETPSDVQGWKRMHYKEGVGFLTPEAENDWKKIEKELEKATLEAESSPDAQPVNEMEVLLRALGERRRHNRGVGHKLKGVSDDYQLPPPVPTKDMWSKEKFDRRMGKMCNKMCDKLNASFQQLQEQQAQFYRSQTPNYQPLPPIQVNFDPKDFLEDEEDEESDDEQ